MPSLGGLASETLVYAYLSLSRDDSAAADQALESLDQATDELAQGVTMPALYGGFSGTGWVSEHLEGRIFEAEGDEDLNEEIDRAVLSFLDHRPWKEDYDLIRGLAGLGVYAVERLPRPGGVACLRRILEHLDELAVERPEGLTWFTRPELLPEHQRRSFPQGYYNLGLAHGVPAVAVLLGAAVKAGIDAERAHRLLEGLMSWILAMRFDAPSQFPTVIDAAGGERPSEPPSVRLAWCYGDAGVAAALLHAARAAGNADWEAAALDVARRAAGRDPETAGVRDAGLCHGSAGLAHVFNRIYQASGEETIGEAARTWYRHVLDWSPEGDWHSGYPSLESRRLDSDALELREELGFLTGATGVALALLAATSHQAPDWDRLLMVDVEPRPDGPRPGGPSPDGPQT